MKRFLLTSLIGGLALLSTSRANAQTFTSIYSFTGGNDGANPYGNPYGLAVSNGILYGTATFGGGFDDGTIFAISTSNSVLTNLYSFTATNPVNGTNGDGSAPNAVLLSGTILYGTALFGGASGNGSVFMINTTGPTFTNLHSFTAVNNDINSDGANPVAGLILSDGVLYGTTTNGGQSGSGNVFALNTNGTGFTNLYSFTALANHINADGANPSAPLISSGGVLYGTATFGGKLGNGTVFALNTNGTSFTNLHSFSQLNNYVNSEGGYPNGLICSSGVLYGTVT